MTRHPSFASFPAQCILPFVMPPSTPPAVSLTSIYFSKHSYTTVHSIKMVA